MSSTGGKSYKRNDPAVETAGNSQGTGRGWVDSAADALNKIHIKKLCFILLIAGYCIIAFSKEKKGVSEQDFWLYIKFILVVLVIYFFLHIIEEYFSFKRKKGIFFGDPNHIIRTGSYKIKDQGRFVGAVIYALLPIFILSSLIYKFGLNFIFYNSPIEGFYNYPRFIWSLCFCFFGFSSIAYRASLSFHSNKAFPQYYLSYFIVIVLVAALNFSLFHLFGATNSYIFYFLAGSVGLILGYHIDQLKVLPFRLINKAMN
ncbi:hypothetical protein ACFL2R_01585 [Patescibacteria group bacterium]